MSARSSRAGRLPTSDELFRPTGGAAADRTVAEVAELPSGIWAVAPVGDEPAPEQPAADRKPSGRERHDEKITVYVSADELFDLEQARLTLKRDYGLRVDRGRIVRASLTEALSDLEENGAAARLISQLRST